MTLDDAGRQLAALGACVHFPCSTRASQCVLTNPRCTVVSISACHAEDPVSIPGGGVFCATTASRPSSQEGSCPSVPQALAAQPTWEQGLCPQPKLEDHETRTAAFSPRVDPETQKGPGHPAILLKAQQEAAQDKNRHQLEYCCAWPQSVG